jgi:hypothetical protein
MLASLSGRVARAGEQIYFQERLIPRPVLCRERPHPGLDVEIQIRGPAGKPMLPIVKSRLATFEAPRFTTLGRSTRPRDPWTSNAPMNVKFKLSRIFAPSTLTPEPPAETWSCRRWTAETSIWRLTGPCAGHRTGLVVGQGKTRKGNRDRKHHAGPARRGPGCSSAPRSGLIYHPPDFAGAQRARHRIRRVDVKAAAIMTEVRDNHTTIVCDVLA